MNYILVLIVFLVCILFIAIGGFFIVSFIKSKANFFKNFFLYLMFGAMLFAGIYVFSILSTNVYYETKYVLIPYAQGNYSEVEGKVENLETTAYDKDIYFEINGKSFHIGNYEIGGVGYQGTAIENDDYLKIKYFEYEENIILKIEKQE